MKKVTLLAAVAFLALSVTSCKKTYHCECTVLGTTVKSASVEYKKADAKTAGDACEATGVCTWVQE